VKAVAGAADYVLDVSRGPAPPVPQTAPSVTGSAVEGSLLTGAGGLWEGSPWTLASAWLRCPAGAAPCEEIDGATAGTYTASPGDVGSRLLFRTTATNAGAAVDADAPLTGVVSGRPPALVSAPTITGDLRVGGTVTADPGVWSGTPPFSYRIRWLRCGDMTWPDDCILDGTEGAQRTLEGPDLDGFLRVVVTASNTCTPGCGSAEATSASTAAVAGLLPVAAVSITGLPRVGETLSPATSESFLGLPAGDIEFYGWYRCPESGACELVYQQREYTVTAADLGSRLKVHIAILNKCLRGCGGSGADSPLTDVVSPPLPPSAAIPPAVTGTPEDGRTLTAADGTWSGVGPIEVARQWRRCDAAGADCVDLPDQTDATLLLGPADIGTTLRIRITATNSGGTTAADSEPSAVVAPAPPANRLLPAVLGTPRRDSVLVADPGDWNGSSPLSFEIAWLRCRKTCVPLGAHGDRYVPTPADIGARLAVRVTAVNTAGSVAEDSPPTAKVGRSLPRIGSPGPDTLVGTRWDDVLRGGAGRDRLRGLAGPDELGGGGGADRVEGGSGGDLLVGGSGRDRLAAGPGADRIEARDGVRDVVACGPGRDVARVDLADLVRGCERVLRPRLAHRPLL
jgi:hypothetical protein